MGEGWLVGLNADLDWVDVSWWHSVVVVEMGNCVIILTVYVGNCFFGLKS